MTSAAPQPSPLLSAQSLSVDYDGAEAIGDFSFDLERHSIVALLGANGAGKSSVLGALAGILDHGGVVSLEGSDVSSLPASSRVKLGICLIPERRELFADMSVDDNLTLGGYVRRGDEDSAREFVYELFPDLRNKSRQLAGYLSGGQQQMVAVGRGLMSQPSVLLLDEPALGLAPVLADEVFSKLQYLNERGLSLIIAEEHPSRVMKLATRCLGLRTGEKEFDLSPDQLKNSSLLESLYFGEGTPSQD